jgi:hypothetical protein
VAEAADLAERVGFRRLLFEAADEHHLVEHLEQRLAVNATDALLLLDAPLPVLLTQLVRVDAVFLCALGDAGHRRAAARLRLRAGLHRGNFEFTHGE